MVVCKNTPLGHTTSGGIFLLLVFSWYNEVMELNYDIDNKTCCPKVDCRKKCKCGLTAIFLPAALGDDSAKSEIAPKNGNYCNAIVIYEANGAVYIYTKEGIPVKVKDGSNS